MSYRIIIAEDEFLLAKNLQALLEAMQHEVVGIAGTGTQVVVLAEQLRPDLILMDIKIPEMDGITAARKIAQQSDIPVVIITAYSDRAFVEGAVEAGVMTYLIKPVSHGDLQAAIDLSMARFRELKALRQEVGDLKKALVQRKIVERAKGILMDRLHLSDQEAFRRLQQLSQRENRPMVDIAQAVITTEALRGESTEAPAER